MQFVVLFFLYLSLLENGLNFNACCCSDIHSKFHKFHSGGIDSWTGAAGDFVCCN